MWLEILPQKIGGLKKGATVADVINLG